MRLQQGVLAGSLAPSAGSPGWDEPAAAIPQAGPLLTAL